MCLQEEFRFVAWFSLSCSARRLSSNSLTFILPRRRLVHRVYLYAPKSLQLLLHYFTRQSVFGGYFKYPIREAFTLPPGFRHLHLKLGFKLLWLPLAFASFTSRYHKGTPVKIPDTYYNFGKSQRKLMSSLLWFGISPQVLFPHHSNFH